jgi:hypothetical protein
MRIHELRDSETARIFCEQSLWLARAVTPTAEIVAPMLALALEMAGAGDPLPPLGFLADISRLALEPDGGRGQDIPPIGPWPDGLTRTYEDHVLGKLYADSSFERGSDAVRRYQGRDRTRGLAFFIKQLMTRADVGGVHFTPAILKALRTRTPDEVAAAGWDSLHQIGPLPMLVELYEELAAKVRNVAAVLGPEDVFELEHGTALAQFSQRVALRQVLQAAACLEERMPHLRPRPLARRHEVPTHIFDEDSYPVGGFTSISTRGTVESLLHSQLAYMERDDRPDLFDIKFLRDELLYYSRDENQFLRRRRTFALAFFSDLEEARCKDADAPWQRIVLAFGLTLAALNKIHEWLGEDALTFDFLFLDDLNQPKALQAEEAVMQMVLREQIANGSANVVRMDRSQLSAHCSQRARRSLCHCLTIASKAKPVEIERCVVSGLTLGAARPVLAIADDDSQAAPDDEITIAAWATTLERLLRAWQ